MTTRKWAVDVGDSTAGAVGFVLHNVPGASAAEALEWAQTHLPEMIDEPLGLGVVLTIYTNTARLSVAHVRPDDQQ